MVTVHSENRFKDLAVALLILSVLAGIALIFTITSFPGLLNDVSNVGRSLNVRDVVLDYNNMFISDSILFGDKIYIVGFSLYEGIEPVIIEITLGNFSSRTVYLELMEEKLTIMGKPLIVGSYLAVLTYHRENLLENRFYLETYDLNGRFKDRVVLGSAQTAEVIGAMESVGVLIGDSLHIMDIGDGGEIRPMVRYTLPEGAIDISTAGDKYVVFVNNVSHFKVLMIDLTGLYEVISLDNPKSLMSYWVADENIYIVTYNDGVYNLGVIDLYSGEILYNVSLPSEITNVFYIGSIGAFGLFQSSWSGLQSLYS